MSLINFSNFNERIAFIIFVAATIFLIVIIASFSYVSKRANMHKKDVIGKNNSIRVYRIDLRNSRVVYFNKNTVRTKKSVNLSAFYSHFSEEDYKKISEWIGAIAKDYRSADQYLEADVILKDETNNTEKKMFSLLKLVCYDEINQVVTLESHLLQYIQRRNKSLFTNNRFGAQPRTAIYSALRKNKKSFGYSFGIRFFLSKEEIVLNNKIEKYKTLIIKNKIYEFLRDETYQFMILDENDNELVLFDFLMVDKNQSLRFAKTLGEEINKTIQTNGFDNSLGYAISIIDNNQYGDDLDEIIRKAQEGCILAQQRKLEILLFRNSFDINHELKKYGSQINYLLQPGSMRYLYQPVVDVERQRILGYCSFVKAYNTAFSDYREMSIFASRVGKNKDLFSVVSNRLITKFNAEKPSNRTKLFMQVSLADIDYIMEVLPQIAAFKEIPLVLNFSESEINENANDLDYVVDAINKIKALGVEISLLFKDKNLLLESDFYNLFDYFFIGASMLEKIKKENVVRLSIHSLVESLLKYNKTLVAVNIDNMQSAELIIKAGITTIASDAISVPNDMLLPIEPKKMKKLIEMNENFN